MHPEIKMLVINALKSEQYQYGRAGLRKGDCFCVLGVIADLFLSLHSDTSWSWEKDTDTDDYRLINNNNNSRTYTCYLPDDINEWAGLKEANDKEMSEWLQLSRINDALNTTNWFPVIEYLESLN